MIYGCKIGGISEGSWSGKLRQFLSWATPADRAVRKGMNNRKKSLIEQYEEIINVNINIVII